MFKSVGNCLIMGDPQKFQAYLEVVIEVLSQQNMDSIPALKAFLSALSSPREIEKVLTSAILHFADHNIKVFHWVLKNAAALEPELNILIFTKKLIVGRLINQGFVQGRDFRFELANRLWVSSPANTSLQSHCEQRELLLIREVLTLVE